MGLVLVSLWTIVVPVGFHQGWFLSSIASSGDVDALTDALEQKVAETSFGNISILIVSDNRLVYEFSDSVGEPVSSQSVFQVASVSKWVALWGVLSLAREGKIDLDAPASRYLTRWQIPDSEFDTDEVTIRRLLSHTAGLESYGYFGFERPEEVQTLEQSLDGALDAIPPWAPVPALYPGARIVTTPGGEWRYTGAGFTMLQLIIEEVSGQSFAVYMDHAVFKPLQMHGTTFDWALVGEGLVDFYDDELEQAPHYLYVAQAAASLYTSTYDLSKFVRAHFETEGLPAGRGLVFARDLADARAAHAKTYGLSVYGLGTFLYAATTGGDSVFGHDGSNHPAINTAVRINPDTRDAIIIFCTGNSGLASRLAGEWVLWSAGKADIVALARVHGKTIGGWIAAGWIAYVILLVVVLVRRLRAG